MTSNHLLLYRIAELMLANGRHVLAVDDLFDDEKIGDFVKSIQIDSPYQQMLYEGVLTETFKDEQLHVTFTVEGYFHFILGEVIYDQSEGKDAKFLISLLNNSKLNGIKEGIEQCLIRDIISNHLERLISFIDLGGDYVEICIRPLLYLMKSYGVETMLNKLLENPTDNDWKALLELNDLLDEFQLQILKKEFLSSVISRITFTNKYDSKLGLIAIAVVDDEQARMNYTRVDFNAGFIQNDSELLSESGQCYERFGEYEKALEFYEKCLALELKSLGGDNPDVATSYFNIGSVLDNLGEYEKALEFYEKCLAILSKTFGGEHPRVATSYNNIGSVLANQGEYEKALEFYEKCLAIDLKTFGSDHPDVATSYNNIGLVWKRKGEYEKALEFYEKCLKIRLKTLGGEHSSVATLYSNIGLVMDEKGQYEKALEFYEKCLEIELSTLGGAHPTVATSYNNIGSVLDNQGEYEKALEFYEKCLAIILKTLGGEHPKLATSYNNIGSVLDNQGEYEKALEFYEKSLAVRLKTLGGDHPDVATSYFNIGSVLANQGEYEKAMEFYEKCLAIELKTLGSEHPSVATSYNNIASVMDNQGEYEKALEYYEKSLELELKTLGNDHTDVATTYLNIGDCFKNLQNLATAIQYYQKGFAIEIKGVYPFRIASCLDQLGDKKEALIYYIQSAEIRKNDPDVGLEDESTQESINHIQRLIKEIDLVEMAKIPKWLKKYIM